MIVAIIPDRFKSTTDKQVGTLQSGDGRWSTMADVRRPTRGIQIKNDTYATMQVLLGNGETRQIVNASSRTGKKGADGKLYADSTSNFLIQSVQEERVEKQQVIETFGEAFVFFYGQRPRVLNIQGVLLNTFDFNWEAEWWHNYDNYLRGTKCVEYDARVYLTFDDTLVSGYIMAASSTKQAQERNYVPLAFQLFVTDYTQLSRVGDPSASQGYSGTFYNANVRRLSYSFNSSKPPGEPYGLLEGVVRSGINAVSSLVAKANFLVDSVLTSSDQWLGNPVRVPYGFAGALTFDVDDAKFAALRAQESPNDTSKPITFTTFAQNWDEYVASENGGAYGSMKAWETGATWEDQSKTGEQVAEEALYQWAQNGIVMPPPSVSKLVALASKTDVGLKVLGAARNVVNKARAEQATANAEVVNALAPAMVPAIIAADASGIASRATAAEFAQTYDRARSVEPSRAPSLLSTLKGFEGTFVPVIGGVSSTER